MNNVINILRWNTGEVYGYGKLNKSKRIGPWTYFYKTGQLRQKGKYNNNGLRVEETWEYYDEKGARF